MNKEPEIKIKRIIVDGQETVNWKKEMESAHYYIALVTEGFYDNITCIEQTLYAKTNNIPTVILHHDDVIPTIPDLFKGMNMVAILNFNDDNKKEITKKLAKVMKEMKKKQEEVK